MYHIDEKPTAWATYICMSRRFFYVLEQDTEQVYVALHSGLVKRQAAQK